VQLKLGARQRKDSLHKEGRNKTEITGCSTQSEDEENKSFRPVVPWDESHVSVGSLLALSYGRKQRKRKRKYEVRTARKAH
jgi:hypothetical protein